MATAKNIRLNTDTGFLKLIAIIAMIVDHVGAALYPEIRVLRIIGRVAFPLFAYSLAVGCVYTRDMRKYALRLLLLAAVSQPIYVMALHHTTAAMQAIRFDADPVRAAILWYIQSWHDPSILLSLLAGALLIWCIKDRRYAIAAILTAVILYFQGYLDYGWRGIALMLLFYAFLEHPGASFLWVAGFMLWWGMLSGGSYRAGPVSFGIQVFAVFALPLIYLPTKTNLKLGKWFFYLSYPAHLALIYAAERFMSM